MGPALGGYHFRVIDQIHSGCHSCRNALGDRIEPTLLSRGGLGELCTLFGGAVSSSVSSLRSGPARELRLLFAPHRLGALLHVLFLPALLCLSPDPTTIVGGATPLLSNMGSLDSPVTLRWK